MTSHCLPLKRTFYTRSRKAEKCTVVDKMTLLLVTTLAVNLNIYEKILAQFRRSCGRMLITGVRASQNLYFPEKLVDMSLKTDNKVDICAVIKLKCIHIFNIITLLYNQHCASGKKAKQGINTVQLNN